MQPPLAPPASLSSGCLWCALPGRPISGLQATFFKVTVPPLSFQPGKPASLHSNCSSRLPASQAGGRGRWPASQFAARIPDSDGNGKHYPAVLPSVLSGTLSLQLCLPRPPVAASLADGWMSPALNRSPVGADGWMQCPVHLGSSLIRPHGSVTLEKAPGLLTQGDGALTFAVLS